MSQKRKREREFANLEHASVVQTEVADVRNGSMMMSIDKEFLEILTASNKVNTTHGSVIEGRKLKKELRTIERKMGELFHSVVDSEGTFENIVILAQAYLNIALVYIKSKRKDFYKVIAARLMRCLQLLEDNLLDPRAIFIVMRALNKLAYISKLNDLEMSKRSLQQAVKIYLAYTKEEYQYPVLVDFPYILGLKEPRDTKYSLDKEYIKTLEFLIIFYSKYGNRDQYKTMLCIYEILNTQLNYIAKITDEQRINWIRRSASLSEFFVLYGRFKEAKNHLSTANYILKKFFITKHVVMDCGDPCCEDPSCKIITYKWHYDHCAQMIADIARNWALYGLELMRFSYERLFKSAKDDKPCKTDNSESNSSTKFDDQSIILLEFDIGESLEDYCPLFSDKSDILKNYDDARNVFGNVLDLFNKAMEFYTPQLFLTDYVQICRDISRAYKYLACYEGHKDNQIELHKQRIQILGSLLNILTPDFDPYKHKWIWYEMGIIYSTLMHLKYEGVQIEDVSVEAHVEVCHLTEQISYNFQNFQSYLVSSVSSDQEMDER